MSDRIQYSWRKMEVTAQDRAGWSGVVCDPLGVTRHESSPVKSMIGLLSWMCLGLSDSFILDGGTVVT